MSDSHVPLPAPLHTLIPAVRDLVQREPGRLVAVDGRIRYLPGPPRPEPLWSPLSAEQWQSLDLAPWDAPDDAPERRRVPPEAEYPVALTIARPYGIPDAAAPRTIVHEITALGRFRRVGTLLYTCPGCGALGGLAYMAAHHRCESGVSRMAL